MSVGRLAKARPFYFTATLLGAVAFVASQRAVWVAEKHGTARGVDYQAVQAVHSARVAALQQDGAAAHDAHDLARHVAAWRRAERGEEKGGDVGGGDEVEQQVHAVRALVGRRAKLRGEGVVTVDPAHAECCLLLPEFTHAEPAADRQGSVSRLCSMRDLASGWADAYISKLGHAENRFHKAQWVDAAVADAVDTVGAAPGRGASVLLVTTGAQDPAVGRYLRGRGVHTVVLQDTPPIDGVELPKGGGSAAVQSPQREGYALDVLDDAALPAGVRNGGFDAVILLGVLGAAGGYERATKVLRRALGWLKAGGWGVVVTEVLLSSPERYEGPLLAMYPPGDVRAWGAALEADGFTVPPMEFRVGRNTSGIDAARPHRPRRHTVTVDLLEGRGEPLAHTAHIFAAKRGAVPSH